ncbi:hypothetical protein E2C01_016438 [Portunus trituberculatus]|uniref:Uncharacterized protein n=1 Tax=Portunus trituberculatus TaxID=210409 RepID=A0A5B7DQR1_PORTR|nr:hypothetical protein [Portunus trituberculatus]
MGGKAAALMPYPNMAVSSPCSDINCSREPYQSAILTQRLSECYSHTPWRPRPAACCSAWCGGGLRVTDSAWDTALGYRADSRSYCGTARPGKSHAEKQEEDTQRDEVKWISLCRSGRFSVGFQIWDHKWILEGSQTQEKHCKAGGENTTPVTVRITRRLHSLGGGKATVTRLPQFTTVSTRLSVTKCVLTARVGHGAVGGRARSGAVRGGRGGRVAGVRDARHCHRVSPPVFQAGVGRDLWAGECHGRSRQDGTQRWAAEWASEAPHRTANKRGGSETWRLDGERSAP